MDEKKLGDRLLKLAKATATEQGMEDMPATYVDGNGYWFVCESANAKDQVYVRVDCRAYYVVGITDMPGIRKKRSYSACNRILDKNKNGIVRNRNG